MTFDLRIVLGIPILGLVALAPMGGSLTAQTPSPYGRCRGEYVTVTGQLRCTPNPCPPGCAGMGVSTPFGPGQVCVCDFIGPQQFCCTIAITELGAYMAWGNCGVFGCPAGELCTTVPASGTVGARCL